jgi:hypothetical protein
MKMDLPPSRSKLPFERRVSLIGRDRVPIRAALRTVPIRFHIRRRIKRHSAPGCKTRPRHQRNSGITTFVQRQN